MFVRSISLLIPLLLLSAPPQALAQTPPESARVEVGVLTCEVEPKSATEDVRNLACIFTTTDKRPNETYTGSIKKLAADGGNADMTVMSWQVLADAPNIDVGALSGLYEGVVSPVGEGKDAKAYLVGGVNQAISLIALSASADQGVNLAGVVAELELKTVKA